mgnify:CR=1 FL=1
MTVVNSMANDTEIPEQKIKETLGYKDDPYSKVEIGVNLTTDSEMAEFDYNAQMAYVAQIQAGSIDIMVMPEKLYQTLKKNEPFADLKELMGEKLLRSLECRQILRTFPLLTVSLNRN